MKLKDLKLEDQNELIDKLEDFGFVFSTNMEPDFQMKRNDFSLNISSIEFSNIGIYDYHICISLLDISAQINIYKSNISIV